MEGVPFRLSASNLVFHTRKMAVGRRPNPTPTLAMHLRDSSGQLADRTRELVGGVLKS
jgi:hypothetical protein